MAWPEIQTVPGSGGRWLRPEPFGATVAFRRPETLVLIDRAFARCLGVSPLGPGQGGDLEDPAAGLMPAAPFEAHLTLDRRCDRGCAGCYIDAQPGAAPGLDRQEWEAVLDKLASLGVYHLALGGGEGTPWDLLIPLAERARQLGMTPNLTTAGQAVTPRVARHLRAFERVHVSLDGLKDAHERMRGHCGYSSALMALNILCAYHPKVGVNCVVGRSNADKLAPLFAALARRRVREIELLRFKPVGRGADRFAEQDLLPDQAARLVPGVLRLALRHRVRVRLDCSFTPMVCAQGISPRSLGRLGLAGCVAGSWLVSIGPDGHLSGCSFDDQVRAHWTELGRPEPMAPYTRWTRSAPEPCRSCRWLGICRGGCHVVARQVCGDFNAADPGCPLVARRTR